MELVLRQNFYNFFLERRYNSEDLSLMFKMQAFDKRKVWFFFINRLLIIKSETQFASSLVANYKSNFSEQLTCFLWSVD